MNRSRNVFAAPVVAWPTLLLSFGAVFLWMLSAALFHAQMITAGLALFLCFVASFAAFTPFHDAAHQSIARSHWINEVVGRICALLLFGPFPAFRYVHLEHHKYTNDPADDPDFWSGRGPTWLLPLRWLSQDFHYYYFVTLRRKERPAGELVESALTLLAIAVAVVIAMLSGHGWEVFLCWVLPSRLALLALAFSFDYLPHRPHQVKSADNPYLATRILLSPVLTVLFIYQNYHLIHHLFPGIPFYRYAKAWKLRREDLIARNATVTVLFPPLQKVVA